MMTLQLSMLAALIGFLVIRYWRSRAHSTFENAFQEHIASIADYYFCRRIPSRSAAIKDCTPMDILWLEYEVNGGIAVKTRLGGPYLGHLNPLTANEIQRRSRREVLLGGNLQAADEIWRGDRIGETED
jgi:hypothetical protein